VKILALERELRSSKEGDFLPHLKAEAARVWQLYQDGVVREIYFRADVRAAVLILECENQEEAQKILGTLPLVKEGLITFDIIPLVAYPGFSRLFAAQP